MPPDVRAPKVPVMIELLDILFGEAAIEPIINKIPLEPFQDGINELVAQGSPAANVDAERPAPPLRFYGRLMSHVAGTDTVQWGEVVKGSTKGISLSPTRYVAVFYPSATENPEAQALHSARERNSHLFFYISHNTVVFCVLTNRGGDQVATGGQTTEAIRLHARMGASAEHTVKHIRRLAASYGYSAYTGSLGDAQLQLLM